MKQVYIIVTLIMISMLFYGKSLSGENLKTNFPEDLNIWIEFNNLEFKECATVWLFVYIENTSTEEMIFPYLHITTGSFFEVHLFDSNGDELPYTGPIYNSVTGKLQSDIVIPSSDTAIFILDLTDGFKTGDFNSYYPMNIPHGEYKVFGKLKPLFCFEDVVTTIKTNELSFKINELTQVEEDFVIEWQKITWSREGWNYRFKKIEELLQKTPMNSLFMPVYRYLIVLLPKKESDLMKHKLRYCEKLVEDFPESGYFEGAVSRLFKHRTDDEIIELFEGNKNFKSFRTARFFLNKVAKKANKEYLLKDIFKGE